MTDNIENKEEENTEETTTQNTGTPETEGRVDIIALMREREEELRIKKRRGRPTVRQVTAAIRDEKLRSAGAFEEYYDAQKLENDKYLHEIFEGNDREYLKNLVRQCKEKKYPASPLLNEFLFLSVLNRRQHINLVFLQKDNPASPDIPKIERRILDYQEKINKIGDTLEKYREEKQKEIDLAELHDTVLKEAEAYIREHIGEYTLKCGHCGELVQTDGLPHWAIKRGVDVENNPVYYIWNDELWLLVEQKMISVAYMAFALHTSIQGIKFTYEERNRDRDIKFPSWIDIAKEEELLKGLQEMWRQHEMSCQAGRITKLGVA
jgi:hypothetical protein